MAINCFVKIGSTSMYPELPIGREIVIISDDRRMANGQLRRAWRAEKYRFTLTLRDADETERFAWLSAATTSASVVFQDEHGATRSCIVMEARDDLVRTAPAVEGGAATTGPGYYDLTVVVEEV